MYVNSSNIVDHDGYNIILEYLANIGVKQGDSTSCKLFVLFYDRVYP